MDELLQILQGYLMGSRGLGECAEWLAGVDWDDPDLTVQQKEGLGLFELLLTDIAEGLREEVEFWEAASEYVAAKTQNVFAKQAFTTVQVFVGSANISSPVVEMVVVEDQELRSWSILPLTVP